MSDIGGLGGAWLISQQLMMYESAASSRRARDIRSLTDQNTDLRFQNAEIVRRYNELVQAYESMRQQASAMADDYGRKVNAIAGLEARVRDMEKLETTKKHESYWDKARIDYLELEWKILREAYEKLAPGSYPRK